MMQLSMIGYISIRNTLFHGNASPTPIHISRTIKKEVTDMATKYVLVGYDKDSDNYDILETDAELINIKNKLYATITGANRNQIREYGSYRTPDGQPYDWLEIYDEQEIGQLDKRMCYTKFNYTVGLLEIVWCNSQRLARPRRS